MFKGMKVLPLQNGGKTKTFRCRELLFHKVNYQSYHKFSRGVTWRESQTHHSTVLPSIKPPQRNFSLTFEIAYDLAGLQVPALFITTAMACLVVFGRSILNSSFVSFEQWKRKMEEFQKDIPYFSKDIGVENLAVRGRVLRATDKTEDNFPTREVVLTHLFQLGYKEEDIRKELEKYKKDERVDVSTVLRELVKKRSYPVYPSPLNNYYNVLQHATFVLEPSATKGLMDDAKDNSRGLLTCLLYASRPRYLSDQIRRIVVNLLVTFGITPASVILSYFLLTGVTPPDIAAAHPYVISVLYSLILTYVGVNVCLLSDSVLNFRDYKKFITKKMELISKLPLKGYGWHQQFFGFVPDGYNLASVNNIPFVKRGEGKALTSLQLFNSFVSIYAKSPSTKVSTTTTNTTSTTESDSPALWKMIYRERTDPVFLFLPLYLIAMLFLMITYRETRREKEREKYYNSLNADNNNNESDDNKATPLNAEDDDDEDIVDDEDNDE